MSFNQGMVDELKKELADGKCAECGGTKFHFFRRQEFARVDLATDSVRVEDKPISHLWAVCDACEKLVALSSE